MIVGWSLVWMIVAAVAIPTSVFLVFHHIDTKQHGATFLAIVALVAATVLLVLTLPETFPDLEL